MENEVNVRSVSDVWSVRCVGCEVVECYGDVWSVRVMCGVLG